MMDKELIQRLTFLIEKAKTRCFVNDARGAYDLLKEVMDLIPVEPFDLTQKCQRCRRRHKGHENPRSHGGFPLFAWGKGV
jgi:hypothetical protein